MMKIRLSHLRGLGILFRLANYSWLDDRKEMTIDCIWDADRRRERKKKIRKIFFSFWFFYTFFFLTLTKRYKHSDIYVTYVRGFCLDTSLVG